MTSENDARALVLDFYELLRKANNGEDVQPAAYLAEDLELTITGSTPISKTYRGLGEVGQLMASLGDIFAARPGDGLYVYDSLCEDNKVVVLARGRAEHKNGVPYNNNYLIYLEVEDGKIKKLVEDLDGSVVMTAGFGKHKVPA